MVDWPASVRALWRETVASALLGVLGTIVSYVLVRANTEWFFSFVPYGVEDGRNPGASTAQLEKFLFDPHGISGLTFFSSWLFTHNAEVSLLCFALGFACCLPTAYLLFANGLMLGAMFALYVDHGLGISLGGWLFIHGVTELFAVTLAGAAGFRIGWTLAFPGQASRLDALKDAGRLSATVMVGVVVMLAFAGLLEGFGREMITSTVIRYAIAVTTAAIWFSYFYLRRSQP
jgi:uncharacterized membrane protein SpoIIM required for sporulation